MEIVKDRVVLIDYTLKDPEGNIIDSSEGSEPLPYLHGHNNLIDGLERQLEGNQKGAELKVVVQPADGYGEHDPELIQELDRTQFAGVEDLDVGMQFQADNEGEKLLITVVEVDGDKVTVDGNHPLAGVELHFDVIVREVRAATDEELHHGHVHGAGGHHH